MTSNEQFTICWIFYSLGVIYAWIYIINYFYANRKYKAYPGLSLIFCCLFGIFAYISPDYYSYFDFIDKVKIYGSPLDVEPLYWSIIPWINYNTFYFRILLLVPSFIGLWYIFKGYSKSINLCISLFIVMTLLSFATAIRSTFADVLFFLGAFKLYKKRTFHNFLFCITTSITSCFFHKSAFMLIVPLVLTFIIGRAKILKIVLISTPILIIISKFLIVIIFSNFFEYSTYQEHSVYKSGSIMIRDMASSVIIFTILVYSLWISRKVVNGPKTFNSYLYKFVFISFIIWIVLSTSGISRYVGNRFLIHSMIPIIILISNLAATPNYKYRSLLTVLTAVSIIVSEFGILTIFRERLSM